MLGSGYSYGTVLGATFAQLFPVGNRAPVLVLQTQCGRLTVYVGKN